MADKSSENMNEKKRHSNFTDFFIRIVREKPLGTAGGVITILLLLVAIFARFLAPHGANELAGLRLQPPSSQFWLGTDNLGRDLLSRVIYGAQISVIVGLGASLLASLVETILGLFSGYLGGKFDLIIQRFVDAIMCFPGLILMMVIISIIGAGVDRVILVLGITWGIGGSRLIRGATMTVKENTYVQSAIALGSPTRTILWRHILPNIMAPIIIQFSVRVPAVILTEAMLSFLGYGVPANIPSWGSMLSGSARTYMFLAPWMAIWPGLALSIVVWAVNIFGDAVRDILDPRLKGGIGRYGLKVKPKVEVSEPGVIAKD
jgi:peptide/nickel transport system permease protein